MAKFIPPRPNYARERASFGYPVLAAFLLLLAARLCDRYLPVDLGALYITAAITVAVFLLPSLVYIKFRGRGYVRSLRLHRIYPAHLPLLLWGFPALCVGATLLSILFGGTESLGNSSAVFEQTAPDGVWSVILMIPVLAILPACLEELLFRGILCTELDRRGMLRTVVVGSLLFALMHFDLSNLPVYFFAGALLTLVLYATDSLIATMLLHALYNLLSLFGQRYLNAFYHFTGSVELFLFFLILMLLLSLAFFARECARLYRMRVQENVKEPRRSIPRDVQLYTMLDALSSPPVIICVILAVIGFILL